MSSTGGSGSGSVAEARPEAGAETKTGSGSGSGSGSGAGAGAGAGASYNVDLEALRAEYQRESQALKAKLAAEQEATAKALTKLEQLQAQLDATPDKQSADAKSLDHKIASTNRALQFASDNIKGYRTDLDHNHAAFLAMLKASQAPTQGAAARDGAEDGAGAAADRGAAAPTGPTVVLAGQTLPPSLAGSLPYMATTSFSTAKPQVTVDTGTRFWNAWGDGHWLRAQESPGASASQPLKRKLATSTLAGSAKGPAATSEAPNNAAMPAPPARGISDPCPAAFAPFIRSVCARVAREAPCSGAGGAGAGTGPSAGHAPPPVPEDHQGDGLAFFVATVAKWKDGAGSTAAGCMMRFVQEKARSRADIHQAAACVADMIASQHPPPRTLAVHRIVAMAHGHLSTAVHLVLDAERFVEIARDTTCELVTECLLNSTVVRQAFMYMPDKLCGSSRLRRALCRTCLPGDNNEFVAEIVQYPDTFSFRKQTPACNVLHEATPRRASTTEIEEDTAKLVVTSAGLAGALQLSINKSVEVSHAMGSKPGNVPGSKCKCFYQGHQEKWMPFPCIQTVGAEFRLYAGKTIHDFKHGTCKHNVFLLCSVDMSERPRFSTLACAALVQSCAWELSTRPELHADAVVPDGSVYTSKVTLRSSLRRGNTAASGRRPGGGNDGSRDGSRDALDGGASNPGANSGQGAGRQHMGEHGFARLGRGVYAGGTPKREDVLALDATGLFEALRPMMVGIPTLGGPLPSAIESEDDSRARVYTARHLDSELDVVIKVLPAEHGSHEAATLRRVNMCARARSVRLVDVVKVGDDKVALVLERAPYMFPLLATRALQQFKQLCEAIEAWHEVGFVHLDIKPGNVALDAGGGVVVLDAGDARKMTGGAVPVSHGHGTPGFVAPELLADDTPAVATAACDVFSLGKMLKYLLDRDMCSEHFDSLLQLATRMTDPNPDLRPVLSEVLCMMATNGLAPDDSPIGAGVAKSVRSYAVTSPTGGSFGALHGTSAVA